jgi:uncharacterized protein (TIGR03435 family)
MMKDMPLNRRILMLLLMGYAVFDMPMAMGQASAVAATKAREFDVASIKPNNSGYMGGAWGVSRNEYRAKNTPLSRIILQAYLGQMAPSEERLKGAPSWVMNQGYDITAKVDDATAESWKDMRQAQQVAMAAPMLRTMLEDRCKLVVHTVPTEVDGYALVVGKNGMKMKEAQPGEPVPARHATFEGGWMMVPLSHDPDAKQSVTYLQITMAQLTAYIGMGGKPIVDQTGLAGKYDFELPVLYTPPPPGAESAAPEPPPDVAHMFDWKAIGLEMKPIKVPALNVVIDHIEQPSAN